MCYELEVHIDAPPNRVWQAITAETNAWWLPDFHMVGEGSTVTLDTRAGGGLIEHLEGGGSLLWYTVQWCRPQEFTLYLIGQTARDWGGPATSHLKLQIEPRGTDACTLKVSDALHGHVTEGSARSLEEGWTTLYSDGLKRYCESRA
jgi:uncharacterized protein YndB with AHSA1/START domain